VPAGYSGTPLAKKLGVKPGVALLLLDAPAGWSIADLPADVVVTGARRSSSAVKNADLVIAFCRSSADVAATRPLVAALKPTASLWLAWPRKAGGHVSDITENLLREVLLPTGLVDVKVAALDDDWSGLKFVWRKENRR
jgi:hypothetical protein